MEIKVIKNKREYEIILGQLSQLMDRNPSPGSDEENTLELLLLVIQDYERRNFEPIVVDPIEAIKFRMDQMQLTRKDLITYMGSLSRVSEVLSGKRNLSLSMIRKLHEGLEIPLESLVTQRSTARRPKRKSKPVKRKISRRAKNRKKSFI